MTYTPGTLTSVAYIDPWGITPPGTWQTGVVAKTSNNPAGLVLAGCIVLGTTPMVSAIAAAGNTVRIVPPVPLSATQAYQCWLQWVTPGTTVEQLVWPAAQMVSATLVLPIPAIASMAVTTGNVAGTWTFGTGAGGVSGANLQIFNAAGQSAGFIQAQGNSGNKAITLASDTVYNVYIQAVQPAFPQTQGGFTAPFAYGSWSPPIPVATAAPTITSLAYDGATLTVGWNAVTVPSSPGPSLVAYSFLVTVGGTLVGEFPGGAGGGVAAIGAVALGAAVSVSARVRFGPVSGPPGTAASAIIGSPTIVGTTVAAAGGAVTVTATLAAPSTMPQGTALAVSLLCNGTAVATANATGTPPVATLSTTPVAGSTYTLVAQAVLAGNPAASGPRSAPAPVVLAAPTAPAISYDGTTLSASWAAVAAPGVAGYAATIVAGSTTLGVTGPETSLAVPLSLGPGQSATVTVAPLTVLGGGLSAQASYSFPAPTAPGFTAANVQGGVAALQWTPAASLALDGYQVMLTGTAPGGGANAVLTQFTEATGHAAVLPADDILRAWTASVAPVVRGSAVGSAAATTALLTVTPAIEAVSLAQVDANIVATIGWSLADYASNMDLAAAQLRVRILDGDATVATHTAAFTGTSGNVTVTLPSGPIARPMVSAQLVGNGVAGPVGAPLPFPALVPGNLIASYDGVMLRLSWAGGGNGVTGHRIVLTPSSGDPVIFAAGPDTSFEAVVALPWGSTWNATVQPVGDAATGIVSAAVAVSLPQVSAPSVTFTRLDGLALSASWSSAGSRNISYRLTLTGGGATIATQDTGPALSATLQLAVTPPPDATLTVTALVGQIPGPASTPAPGQGAVPTIARASIDAARQVSLTRSVPNGVTLTAVQPVAVWPGTESALPAAAATSPTSFVLPATVPNGAAIVLRGVNGVAMGTASAGVQLPTLAPTGFAIRYDGTTIDATWDPGPDGFTSGYETVLRVTGAPPVEGASAVPYSAIAYTPPQQPADAVATLEIAAVAGAATGPACAARTVITQVPQLTSASYDGASVALIWAAAPTTPATGTLVRLLNGGGEAASAVFSGTSGSFDAGAGPLSVTVQATGPGTTGPVGSAVALITAAPAIQSVAFAADGSCTITWATLAGASDYRLVIVRSGATVSTQSVGATQDSTVSVTLPAGSFAADLGYSVAVSASQVVGSCTVTGPLGDPVPVVARAPGNLVVSFDGGTVTAVWSAVPDAGVFGYRVSLLSGGTATKLGDTSGTSAALPVTNWTASDSILVQALAAQPTAASVLVTGPAAQAPLTTLGLFLSSDAAMPHIAPAKVAPITASDVVMLLPDLFPTVPDPMPDVAPFALSLIGDPPQGSWQPGLWYKLTLAQDGAAWNFTQDTSTIRTGLLQAYQQFLGKLHDASAPPVSIATVQQAIARAMPQTFAETLLYSYGIDFTGGSFDLRPGMILRAEYESYQSLGAVPDSQYLSGFVTSGVAEYAIASYSTGNNWLTGLDTFLANLTAANGLNVNPVPPVQGKSYGGGGVLDIFFTQFEQPFVRLVYAPDLLASNSTGSAILQRNPVLIAAGNLSDLDTATDSLRAGDPPGSAVASCYLRGRVTFSAAIDVFVNGTVERVAIGTTVGNLLAARAARPPIAGLPLAGVRLTRPAGAAILAGGTTTSYAPGEGLDIRLDWTGGHAYAATSDWLDLPLLHGDRILLSDALL